MTLHFKIIGNQTQHVIILHGLLGCLDNWQNIAKKLSQYFTVHLLDIRNHGKSPHSDEHNYSLIAEDILEYMEAQGLASANFIGHSMGGKSAMKFIENNPDRVQKLVVIDISPKQYPAHHNEIFQALQSIPINQLKDRKEAEMILRETLTEDGVILFLLKNLTRNGEGYEWKMNLPVLTLHYDRIIESTYPFYPISNPTLFIRGALSDYITDDDALELSDYFIDSTLITIDQAGHWVHAEQPEILLDKLLDFLQ